MAEQFHTPHNIQHRGSKVDEQTRDLDDEIVVAIVKDVDGQGDNQMVAETEALGDTEVTFEEDARVHAKSDMEVTPLVDTDVTSLTSTEPSVDRD